MSADGGIKFGPYVLLRRLARGGMAEVFLAQQRGLEGFDRRVAVKRILPHLADTPDFVKMFLGEAKLAAQLTHPNVVHIYDFGKVDNDYFIAMEYVDGVHAGQLFKQGDRDRMPPTLVARIGADAAAALNYAHEVTTSSGAPLGLVHRDVSPANIMVSYDGIVKLCDFGIAKAASANNQLTNPGQVKGKYAYMSPEQTIASPLDGRSDVFSLGIVLWELLAGKTIVPRGDAIEAMRAIRDGKLTPISQVAPATPPPLAKAINWALETRREKRATATEFAQALEAFIKLSPELATPMQLAAWVRTRFPRDATGPVAALGPKGEPGTNVAGGTFASPSTMVAPNTLAGSVVTPPSQLIAASRLAPEDNPFDHQETIAIESKLPDRSSQATLFEDPDEPTLKPGQRPVLQRPGQNAGAATIIVEDTSIDVNETIVRDSPGGGARIGPIVPRATPGAIQTLTVPPLTTYPQQPLDTTTKVRTPPPRAVVIIVALGALTLMTFLIVVASQSGQPRARGIAAIDARLPDVVVATPDAAEAIALVVDAGAFEPTISVDAAPAATLLEVHTRPDGATVKVGDQSRMSPARFAVPPGHHIIIAELRGYEPERREVDLLLTEHLNQEIAFTRRLGNPTRPVAATGKLTIRTTPYSEVFSNGKKIGEAPFADLAMPAGSYTLTFKNPTRPTLTKRVTITAGKTTKLGFSLPL